MNYKKNILKLSDTINIPDKDDGTPLVALDPNKLRIRYDKDDMKNILGDIMFVRETVAKKLYDAQTNLMRSYPQWQLFVKYAYRSPEIQSKYFESRLFEVKKNEPNKSTEYYLQKAHSMSAHPKTAGHTLGAAVDLTIWDKNSGVEIDMGSRVAEFGDIAYTEYPHLTVEQKNNRHLLQKYMTEVGFAPYLGEWWHFSYGDKEWAAFYKKPSALYRPIPLNKLPIK